MACVKPVFDSKRAFIRAIDEGRTVILIAGRDEGDIPADGKVVIEGPDHANRPTWRAIVTLEDGLVTRVR